MNFCLYSLDISFINEIVSYLEKLFSGRFLATWNYSLICVCFSWKNNLNSFETSIICIHKLKGKKEKFSRNSYIIFFTDILFCTTNNCFLQTTLKISFYGLFILWHQKTTCYILKIPIFCALEWRYFTPLTTKRMSLGNNLYGHLFIQMY